MSALLLLLLACVRPDLDDCTHNGAEAGWAACEDGVDAGEQRGHISDPTCLGAFDAAYEQAYATCQAGGDHTG